MHSPFIALDVAHALVRAVSEPIAHIARRDPKLADQLRRAAASVPLNVAEGNHRSGRDRLQSFRIAAGSAAEVEAALVVAEAFGYLSAAAVGPARALADRGQRLLRGLTR